MLFRNILKILSGNIFGQLINFVTFILISRELGASKFGILSTILAVQFILIQASSFGISISLPKLVSRDLSSLNDVYPWVLGFRVFCTVISSIIGYLYIRESIGNDISNELLIASLCIASGSMFMFSQTIQQSLGLYSGWAKANLALNFLKLVSIILLIYGFKILTLEYVLLIYFAIPLLVSVVIIVRIKKLNYSFNNSFSNFFSLIKASFWIFLSSMVVAILMRLDVLMLNHFLGTKEVGVYAVANQVAMVFALFTGAVNTVLLPEYKKLVQQMGAKNLRHSILKFTPIVFFIAGAFYVLSPYILILFGDGYTESAKPLAILLVSYCFGMIVNPLSLTMYEANKSNILLYINVSQLIINFVSNLFLIPKFGILGAAMSAFSVRFFGAVCIILLSKKYAEEIDKKVKNSET
ncbi:oligosaccharide flippase family protein [Catenovulum sp. 2E275]|uniref:oligosaccharide flippase family protein n=1 Tax=Catenovulum sp. 2E275 TaxID=2980497 RepID=UPI0021CF1E15|nr:oligosaccharide flippase family protein [Catenovulum sp. 2E275]MCU4677330.1 oligosaccharide flippase family protein [Catenovulum sp. 2E275]